MKNLLFLFILFLSSCCVFTSQDCNCDPPNPTLSEETLAWIAPYDSSAFLVFQDSMGSIDTLQISRSSDTEDCGGEECSSECEVEIARLTSTADPQVRFSIRATLNTEVQINSPWVFEGALFAVYDTKRDDLYVESTNSSGTVLDNYDWNGLNTEAINLRCTGEVECPDFPMREMLVSREYGLIKYVTPDGHQWEQKQ